MRNVIHLWFGFGKCENSFGQVAFSRPSHHTHQKMRIKLFAEEEWGRVSREGGRDFEFTTPLLILFIYPSKIQTEFLLIAHFSTGMKIKVLKTESRDSHGFKSNVDFSFSANCNSRQRTECLGVKSPAEIHRDIRLLQRCITLTHFNYIIELFQSVSFSHFNQNSA